MTTTRRPPSLRRTRLPRRLLAGAAVLVSTSAGCATQGLAFRADDRIDIVAPGENDEVTLPVTLKWTARDYNRRFGVFVDRAAQPPGKPLWWISRDDDDCDEAAGCPDETYLAERGVYTTTEHELVIQRVANKRVGGRRCSTHEATVVLLDDNGKRRGESAWGVSFRVCRD